MTPSEKHKMFFIEFLLFTSLSMRTTNNSKTFVTTLNKKNQKSAIRKTIRINKLCLGKMTDFETRTYVTCHFYSTLKNLCH